MITRAITPAVDAALARQAAVAILGPRQVGKTTLALEIGAQRQAIYLDLEDPDDRARLASLALFLEAHQDQLVILDEIHRMPELFDTLRGIIDRGRRSGWGRGRFLIVGSARLGPAPAVRDAGRQDRLYRDGPPGGTGGRPHPGRSGAPLAAGRLP